jgi:predicted HicB family RNase H-like nuclease
MELIVQDVPDRVLARLQADAKRRDVSINEAVTGILAGHYGVQHEPSGVKWSGPLTRTTLLLSMSDDLHRRIKIDAAGRKGVSMRGLIVQTLASHYKIPAQSAARRPRTTAAR